MASPPKLTGETLIVHHIPLVHCQVPDRPGKRANPFCPPEVGAACTSSLPEWDFSQTDSLVYSSLLRASDTDPLPAEAAGAKEGKPRDSVAPGAHKRQNPFLLGDSNSPQGLPEEDPGHKSFHLHSGKSTSHLRELALPPFRLHDPNPVVKPWSAPGRLGVAEGQEDKPANDDVQKASRPVPDNMDLDGYGCPRGDLSSLSLGPEWANDTDEPMPNQEGPRSRTCSCSSSEPQRCRCHSLSSHSEPLDQQMGYISDSSCNSSDGVLVNFSALYHKMNGHPHSNLNSANLSCDSSLDSHSDTGAFYLDLHSSPLDSKMSCKMHSLEGSGKACGCHHPSSPVLDANCNSYLPPCEPCTSEGSDLTSCFQSQARLVVATQNYYKLVTCDLSSQSSPSPAGSSITSCSEEHAKGSPLQPTEYYLFQRPPPRTEDSSDTDCSREGSQGEAERNTIEGQVYVNISPPTLTGGRQRSRSYDRNLDRSPTVRLGSLERMMSCPVKLSDSPSLALQGSPPKRVTSFAELAKGRKKTGSSPPLRGSRDSSLEFSPIPESQKDGSVFLEDRCRHSQSLPPMPLTHSLHRSPERGGATSGRDLQFRGMPEQPALAEPGANPAVGLGQKDVRARADGGTAESKSVVRYSKEQRPTTLPIQPFVFQHHFAKPSKGRSLNGHFACSLSQLYSLSAANRSAGQQLSSTSQSSASATSADQPMVVGTLASGQRSADGAASLGDGCAQKSVPETTRPSPLGSYSPVRSNVPFFQKGDSSSCSLTPESHPPRSRSCPVSANLLPTLGSQATRVGTDARTVHEKESPRLVPSVLPEQNQPREKGRLHGGPLPPLVTEGLSVSRVGEHADSTWKTGCNEPINAGSLGPIGPRPLNGPKQLPLIHSDFFPDYFSLAEKPPAEFCLSPDGNTESVSIDLLQKKGLVKAINTAVDLIVAHFGTSRDAGVKAKLGNSSVSPNVGHLILKYLCPAIRDVLSDGLKAYVLDVIVGQRQNVPWSVVEASTQLGPSTKVLHGLCQKVSQYPELTSHAMRFNAFILGLLNIRSLEFWFNHLYNHEDIVQAHYQPVGFLSLSHGVCQGLFEEVLLLLQPLSLLPFSLDLLFEHHLLQMGREQQQRKELLCTQQDLVLSAHSTLQLMRTHGGMAGRPGQEKKGGVREEGAERRKAPEASSSELRKDKQASWWYQLMQSSQVYIEGSAEGSRFIRYERKKKAGLGATVQQAESRKGPPPREGVVEGAEACPIVEVPRMEAAVGPGQKKEPSTREEVKEKSRPFWMGSPPDSVLTELKRTKEKEHGSAPGEEGPGQSRPGSQQPKWGHLFGSRKVPGQAARMPSGWLSLDRSVFQMMAQTVGAGMWKEAALDPERLPANCAPSSCPKKQPPDRGVPQETPCEVKALCHHIATEAGQLSFKKGDVLRVSGKVDADWLQCSRGAETGLVPIMYVTHVEDKDY